MESYTEPFIFFAGRIILGALFFFQAYDKIFNITLRDVQEEVFSGTRSRGLPDWFSKISVYFSTYLELIGGLLLITGLFTVPVLFLFGIHLILLVLAFGFLQGLWDMKHVFPRLALLFMLLLLPQEWNQWSLDYFLPG